MGPMPLVYIALAGPDNPPRSDKPERITSNGGNELPSHKNNEI